MEYKRQAYFTHGTIKETGQHFTVCALIRNDATYIGVTYCSPEDQFSRPEGRKQALKKAVHDPTDGINNVDVKKALDMMHTYRNRIIEYGKYALSYTNELQNNH